jgi:hypothetical protein
MAAMTRQPRACSRSLGLRGPLPDLSNTAYQRTLSGPQQQLAQAMKQDWTNFATAGVPASG